MQTDDRSFAARLAALEETHAGERKRTALLIEQLRHDLDCLSRITGVRLPSHAPPTPLPRGGD